MNKRVKFQPKPVSRAIGAFGVLLAASAVQAGPGFGDAYDLNNNPFVVPSYFASSPSGARLWTGVNPDGSSTGVADPLTGAPEGFDPANRLAYQQKIRDLFPGGYTGTGKALRKFVDPLPLPGAANARMLADGVTTKYIPVASATKWVNPQGVATGDDYYEVAVVEYAEKFHTDLRKATTLRGYVQIDHLASNGRGLVPGSLALSLYYPNSSGKVAFGATDTVPADARPIMIAGTDANGKMTGTLVAAKVVDQPRYLGPVIAATKDIPTRVKFLNLLPVGRAVDNGDGTVTRNGDTFLPVDPSIVGAGYGPDGQHLYTSNRANMHLHGGDNIWISDGTPHQWITPAGEADPAQPGSLASDATLDPTLLPEFLRGASAVNVPDMNDPGPGANTYFFTNGQSARMEWYHDHSVGITRLNVMAGMASAYLLTDPVEQDLIARGVLPAAADTIPLVLQDKTFVPDDIALQDARWHTTAWGAPGDMWYPHVYETVQDPNQATNFNAVGRWHWGPWFWPVFPALYTLPTGAYGDATTVPEAWGDTPLINGVAYPTLTVDPKAYRLRILNASNDRFMTFNMFVADDSVVADDGRTHTEVKMVPPQGAWSNPCAPGVTRSVNGCAPENWPTAAWGHPGGVPDFNLQGPRLLQIANEGGLLPGVAPKDPTPINYLEDKGRAAVLNVLYSASGLQLANAERADVVVDFSAYAGKTLIVYNDSGAPVPAADPRNEYFTGVGDQSNTGGAEDTLVGYGPNTRTMMQIKVRGPNDGAVPAAPINEAALDAEIKAAYKASQETPIVAQSAYNAALGTNWDDSKAFASIFTGSLKEPTFSFVPGNLTPAKFNSIVVTAKGSGYVRPPAVALSGGGGTAATAAASLKIEKLHVIDGGSGYKVAPVVSIASNGSGNGAGATTTLKLTDVQVTAGGTGYSKGQVGSISLTSAGNYFANGVTTIAITNAGRYSNNNVTVAITGGGGTGATATVTMGGTGNNRTVTGVTITNPGKGYTSAPTLTFSNGLVRATATATVGNASTAPTVSFPTPAGGAPATGTVQFNSATGQVTGVTITDPGRGYAAAPVPSFTGGTVTTAAAATTTVTALPTITFPRPLGQTLAVDGLTRVPGVTATGIAQVSATGAITGVTITNPGSGYTIAPTPVVTATTGTGARLASTGSVGALLLDIPDPTNPDTAGGGGYSDLSTLASEPSNLSPGLTIGITPPTTAGGVRATAGATGKVFDITVTNFGSGYTSSPGVGISLPTANPVLAGAFPAATVAAATAVTDTANGTPRSSFLVKAKAIQELFEPTYGRLNATLGIEVPFSSALTQTTIPLGYVDGPTEQFGDGETQIWKITHNGVDTHPVHFHLLNVQLINRVGWDNFVDPPEANELGWKETVKMSPLEDVIVAVRAKKPKTPGFGLPNSVRLLDPTQPEGAMTGFTQIDPATGLPAAMANIWQDFGWEYVWHCHILGHEENDFMRAVVFDAKEARPLAASGLSADNVGDVVNLAWTDLSTTEFQYRVERAAIGSAVWEVLDNALANATQYTDTTAGANAAWQYRVVAVGQAGEAASNVAVVAPAPTNLGTLVAANRTAAAVSLSWGDATNETSYQVQRAPAGSTAFVTLAAGTLGGNVTTFEDATALAAAAYDYRVLAINQSGQLVSNVVSVGAAAQAVPGAPRALGGNKTNQSPLLARANLTWQAANSGGAAASYRVEACSFRFPQVSCTNFIEVGISTTTSAAISDLNRGWTYRFRVQGINATGTGAYSALFNLRM
ncbi:MAG: hypothetical protein RLZZ584_533 [Pseudomonadota bacterium]